MGKTPLDTPRKIRIKSYYEALVNRDGKTSKTAVALRFGISRPTLYKVLASEDRSFHYLHDETRGRPKKLSDAQCEEIAALLDSGDYDTQRLTWRGLAEQIGVDACEVTVRATMKEHGYGCFIACQKNYLKPTTKQRRVEYARVMLERYPQPKDWYHVRFSDESHFGYGPECQDYIKRKRGTRYEVRNISEKRQPVAKDQRRLHAWAAVGFNFKSNLYFYNVPSNTNGKLSLQIYRDCILEPVVKSWLLEGHDFVLEEDNDSGHGTGRDNIVRTWKQDHRLRSYWNCSQSPDLSPIENYWQAAKDNIRQHACWSNESLKSFAVAGWEGLSQETINRWIDTMPRRLQDVIDGDGAMTGW